MTIFITILGSILSIMAILTILVNFTEKSLNKNFKATIIMFAFSVLIMKLWEKVLIDQDSLLNNVIPHGNYQTGIFNTSAYVFMIFTVSPLIYCLIINVTKNGNHDESNK